MKRVFSVIVPTLVIGGLIVLFGLLLNGKTIDVLEPTGEVGIAQRDLLLFTTALSLVVVVPVFTLLVYIAFKYRAGNTSARYTPEWGENRYLEGLWWGIPIVIIGILGVVIYQTSHSLDPYKALSGEAPLEVQVVALRWKWLFIYPDYNVATLNHLPIPVDRPVRFAMTADAPMSAFWIPSLGSQVYAMNGMESQLNLRANTTGEFRGYTTNINGEGYAKMTFQTRVIDAKAFEDWTVTAQSSKDDLTMSTYELLSAPKSETDERTYRLSDKAIFDNIVRKYGHSHATPGKAE